MEDEGESKRINTDPMPGIIHSSLVAPIWDFSLTAGLYSHLYKMQFLTPEPSQATEELFQKIELGINHTTQR